MSAAFAAVDLGVERGRVVVGRLDGGQVSLREVHRFATPTVRVDATLRWNIRRLYGEILAGLSAAARAYPGLTSVAIDAWGMDFGLLDGHGTLLGDPFHHRDRRTDGICPRLHGRVPEADLWAATGVQGSPFDTLHQLYAMRWRRSSTLHRASRLLLIPDLLTSWLCGVEAAEHTIASTTQCYDLERRAWITPLLGRADIPVHLFPPVVPPATVLGSVGTAPARRAGLSGVQVVVGAAHQSAAAIAAVPSETAGVAYVVAGASSSLVGAAVAAPIRTEAAWKLGFTNQGGVGGTVCLHREVGGGLSGPGAALVVPAVERLAWEYRRALRELEELGAGRVEAVHLVGEGARNAVLCQRTADACGRPVLAGPVDAAALGNVLAQAVATGACASWQEARVLVRTSFAPTRYEPNAAARWHDEDGTIDPALESARPDPAARASG